jgi:hypothetical protein
MKKHTRHYDPNQSNEIMRIDKYVAIGWTMMWWHPPITNKSEQKPKGKKEHELKKQNITQNREKSIKPRKKQYDTLIALYPDGDTHLRFHQKLMKLSSCYSPNAGLGVQLQTLQAWPASDGTQQAKSDRMGHTQRQHEWRASRSQPLTGSSAQPMKASLHRRMKTNQILVHSQANGLPPKF